MSRANPTGPAKGGYVWITLTPFGPTATPGAVTTVHRFGVPQGFRIQRVMLGTASSAGGASRPTVAIDDGTNNLFSGTVSLISSAVVTVTPTSSPSLVAAERDFAQGDTLLLRTTTVASEAVAGYTVMICGYVTDHAVSPGPQPDQND